MAAVVDPIHEEIEAAVPQLDDEHIESMCRSLREIAAEQAYEEDGMDDADVDDEWIDWVETYEEAVEGLGRLGIDPYDEPMEWVEFLDPLGNFEPQDRRDDEQQFLRYLRVTYGSPRS